jgi:hypothetical protein
MFPELRDVANAFCPDKWTILGIPLADFCDGHRLLLALSGVTDLTRKEDLIRAVLICSRDWEDGCKFLHADARGKLSLRDRIFSWRISLAAILDRSYVAKNAKAFEQYMDEADRLPAGICRAREEDKTKVATIFTPAPLLNILDLCKFGLTQSQVLNMPLRASKILRYAELSLPENGKVIEWLHPAITLALEKRKAAAHG